jgi:chromosome segregation ATPase
MIKDFSTVFWGYLPMTKTPYKVHGKVNAFIGQSGHGKTTIWDGLRLMLGASHFESKRTFSFYVQKSNWAVVRIAFHNISINGKRPFERVRKFKDEVTACCRIFKTDQGSWSREYYFFDGEFNDLVDLQINTKAYSEASLTVGQYLELLEQCLGITKEFRNLMAMSPDTVREVVNLSPHMLFQLVFDLKGTKDYKKRYDESKERLSEQGVAIERAEEEMEEARKRFEGAKQKSQKFRLYQEKEKEIEVTEINLKKLEYLELQQALESTKDEMTQIKKQEKLELNKVNTLTVKITDNEKEITKLNTEYQNLNILEDRANQDVIHYISDKKMKEKEIEVLRKRINEVKLIEPQTIDHLENLRDSLKEKLNQKKVDYSKGLVELKNLEQKLCDLENNLLPYRDEAKKFRKILEVNRIPFIMLADAISVKPEMRKWQKAIEAYIGNNRYRFIIESDHYLIAKKLQQEARYGARLSLPRSDNGFQSRLNFSYPSIRSAISVTHNEKVEGYLGRLNHVYLVETVEEGHALQAKGIESITIEGLLQDDDGAIYLKYHSLCCGKLAIEEEKKQTKELLFKQKDIVNTLNESVRNIQDELGKLKEGIEDQQLLFKLEEMENSYRLLLSETEQLSNLIGETTYKRKKIKHEIENNRDKVIIVTEEKAKFIEVKKQAKQKMEDLSKYYAELQGSLDSFNLKIELAIVNMRVFGLNEEDFEFISYDVQGKAFKDQQGNTLTSNDMQNKLNILHREKSELYDPSVNEEIVRVVKAQEGQVELLLKNLKELREERDDLERTCDDLLYQFRSHIKEIIKDYIEQFVNLAKLLKATAKGRLVEITPEPETWEIHLFIGYDGKEPIAVDGPYLSSGQKASTSLMILLAALSDSNDGITTPIMFLDEPKARVDDDRGNEIGQLLQATDIQYFITHQQGESLKTIDWIDHAFTCSACEPGKEFANPLILKKRVNL